MSNSINPNQKPYQYGFGNSAVSNQQTNVASVNPSSQQPKVNLQNSPVQDTFVRAARPSFGAKIDNGADDLSSDEIKKLKEWEAILTAGEEIEKTDIENSKALAVKAGLYQKGHVVNTIGLNDPAYKDKIDNAKTNLENIKNNKQSLLDNISENIGNPVDLTTRGFDAEALNKAIPEAYRDLIGLNEDGEIIAKAGGFKEALDKVKTDKKAAINELKENIPENIKIRASLENGHINMFDNIEEFNNYLGAKIFEGNDKTPITMKNLFEARDICKSDRKAMNEALIDPKDFKKATGIKVEEGENLTFKRAKQLLVEKWKKTDNSLKNFDTEASGFDSRLMNLNPATYNNLNDKLKDVKVVSIDTDTIKTFKDYDTTGQAVKVNDLIEGRNFVKGSILAIDDANFTLDKKVKFENNPVLKSLKKGEETNLNSILGKYDELANNISEIRDQVKVNSFTQNQALPKEVTAFREDLEKLGLSFKEDLDDEGRLVIKKPRRGNVANFNDVSSKLKNQIKNSENDLSRVNKIEKELQVDKAVSNFNQLKGADDSESAKLLKALGIKDAKSKPIAEGPLAKIRNLRNGAKTTDSNVPVAPAPTVVNVPQEAIKVQLDTTVVTKNIDEAANTVTEGLDNVQPSFWKQHGGKVGIAAAVATIGVLAGMLISKNQQNNEEIKTKTDFQA